MPVWDIRGTHGSGKSYIIHQLFNRYGNVALHEQGKHIAHLAIDIDAAIVGPYRSWAGGCDHVQDPHEIIRRIELLNDRYTHVIFEGMVTSHVSGKYILLARRLGIQSYTFCFLNTPRHTCIARVRKRRIDTGRAYRGPVKVHHILTDYDRTHHRLPTVLRGHGMRVLRLDYTDPVGQLVREMGCQDVPTRNPLAECQGVNGHQVRGSLPDDV